MRQVLHPPVQPQEAHEGSWQGRRLGPRGQRGQRQWGVRQQSQLRLQPESADRRNRFWTSGRNWFWTSGGVARLPWGRPRGSSGIRRSSRGQVWESSSSSLHRRPYWVWLLEPQAAAIFWRHSYNVINSCDDQTSVNYAKERRLKYVRWPYPCSTISVRSCLKCNMITKPV